MKGKEQIDRLIVNSPYEEPKYYWRYNFSDKLFYKENSRRPAGYVIASSGRDLTNDIGTFVKNPVVNQIRKRVAKWRKRGYPGITGVTKRLMEYWCDPEEFETRRFFFCQLEAIETLIWFVEAPEVEKTGIELPSDGGEFSRMCAKMATGTGKTLVMAMVIAWQILNKLANPRDKRFSKNILVVAPGLTIRNRLAVLEPKRPQIEERTIEKDESYYSKFRIVPSGMMEKLRQGRVIVRNWHVLNWDSEEKVQRRRSVDKRGVKSDEAYVRDVLGDMSKAQNLLVINDEAHHAWRVPAEIKGVKVAEKEQATKWIGGLDRIHRSRGILRCLDFSATPFTPSGKKNSPESLFGWIVSDFGLNDAIESGLVKTPRVVIRDDANQDVNYDKSRFYHIFNDKDVKSDLNRPAKPVEPLPDLVTSAYYFLGYDWEKTANVWQEERPDGTPPVMITVANRTHTAARIKHALDHGKFLIDKLKNPERTLHIDTNVLEKAEEQESAATFYDESEGAKGSSKLTKEQQAERLRKQVDTVGQINKPGGKIQNVISVGMLSEGWDAKTVTHIMGLRAFTSQLLCEQVVGRGLRRTSYDVDPETNLLEAEYVNIFGVPFTFLPHEGQVNGPPPPPPPKTLIQPENEKESYAICWPSVERIEHSFQPKLTMDLNIICPLELDASKTAKIAELAPTIFQGQPDVEKISRINLEDLAKKFRTQRIIFETVRDVYDQMNENWVGSKTMLIAQLVRLVENFIHSNKIIINPYSFSQDDFKRRLVITLNLSRIVQHISQAIRFESIKNLKPVFDREHPICSTSEMSPWFTGKPCYSARRCHINYCVVDSDWEKSDAFVLSQHPNVSAWVKNDHLNFEIYYFYEGRFRKYIPDFLVKLTSGSMLILETKGVTTEQDKIKWKYLDEWVNAVNNHGEFGHWLWCVTERPGQIYEILNQIVLAGDETVS